MQSKGAKKNLKLVSEPTTRRYSKECKNALNLNYYVMAKMKPDGEGEHMKAKIVECRLKKGVDSSGDLTKDSYEYYLHFVDFDRRMDRWIPSEHIRTTKDYIEDDRKKKDDKEGDHDGSSDEHEGLDHNSRLQHEEATRLKTIFKVKFGRYYAETWYYSPYPDEFHDIECIYYCEFCLNFYVSENELKRHLKTCKLVHPPGNLIYIDQESKFTVWEIDSSRNFTYCENLSYLSKLFLDHKLLVYPLDMFLYFCLCEYDEHGHHLVGYFSKNKYFSDGCNLSCILCLPFYQRRGFGKFLITLSYDLSQIEGKIGSPERPLSDLGKKSYIAWWTQRIIDYIRQKKKDKETFSLKTMSEETFITLKDIQDALEKSNLIKKYQNQIFLCTDEEVLSQVYKLCGRPSTRVIKENLHWVPYSARDPNAIIGNAQSK